MARGAQEKGEEGEEEKEVTLALYPSPKNSLLSVIHSMFVTICCYIVSNSLCMLLLIYVEYFVRVFLLVVDVRLQWFKVAKKQIN